MTALDPRALEAAMIAGWNACRKSIYAVCEDVQSKAEAALDKPSGLARGPLESQHECGFYRGEKSTAKSIARGFSAMEARDDDNLLAALASLPPAPAGSVGEDDATLTFANGEIYGLTMEQGRRAIAAALQADTIPSAIDGAIKGMRVLRTMLNSRGLGGAEVAEAIIADLERINADPAAVPAPPVQEPVAWRYRLFMELGQVETRLSADRLEAPFGRRGTHYDPSYTFDETPLYASPSPLPVQEDGWQPIGEKDIHSAPWNGKAVWLAFDPDDWMTCEGRYMNGAWFIAATFYDPSRDPPMVYRELRVPETKPVMWRPLPAPPQPQETKP